MNIGLLSILHTQVFDFHRGLASNYATALKNAIELHVKGEEKKQGFFFSTGRAKAGLEDKLYVGNIHRIENHLYWNDEELAEDDQIVNVVWVDGPITRDGGACSYGTKDMRDQVLYANTIPQVVGHLFYINTPGGESAARNDYEMMINDCREKGKPTVAFVDGLCASSGVNLASRCDRIIVMNPRDEFGCIGSMAAFWATPDGAIDQDGTRYVEIVGKYSPEKNAWWREAAKGNYEKLQADIDKSTEEFHQSVRENRPLVKDWMLTGEVFEAQQLIPALVDEIGDYNRAIECVFQLADQTLPAARFAVEEPDDNGDAPEGKGPETKEVATLKNNKEMTEEEKKAQEAAAAQAAEQEAAEKEAQEAAEKEAEEKAAQEAAEKEAAEKAAQEAAEKEAQEAAEKAAQEAAEKEAAEKEAAEKKTIEEAQEEIDKIQETLHNAETMIADKDKTIAGLKEALEASNTTIADRDKEIAELKETVEQLTKEKEDGATQLSTLNSQLSTANETIEAQKKQLAEKEAELKEMAEKPAQMAGGKAPADNGTGEAPRQKQCKYHRGMSYAEYREAANEK